MLADTATLDTLPERQIRAGYAESIKHALILDAAFFSWHEAHGRALLDRDPDALALAIRRNCEIKADVVRQDARESGLRAILNFGHTFGHALEALAGYDGRILHGEAVIAGMVQATLLSVRLGLLAAADRDRILAHFGALGLLGALPSCREIIAPARPEALLAAMRGDKKADAGGVRFVLLREIGRAGIGERIDDGTVMKVIEDTYESWV